MKTIITTYACLLFAVFLTAQPGDNQIWPGDMNDNGVVNEVDMLYWGIAFGAEGPSRGNVDGTFKGYPYPNDWPQFFQSNGLNYFFADANGDGKVDAADLFSIEQEFSRTHGPVQFSDAFPINPEGTSAPISISSNVTQLVGAKQIEIIIELGTEAIHVDSFYGFSFHLFYDTLFAKQGISSLDWADDNWIQNTETDSRLFYKDHPDEGYAQVAISRTNQETVGGFGKILRGIIVVEDIIFSETRDTFDVRLDSTRLISSKMEAYVTLPTEMKVASVISSTRTPVAGSNELSVYPNPANGLINIELKNPADILQRLQLYNSVGQSVGKVTFLDKAPSYIMSIAHLSKGIYTIVAESKKGIYSQKIFIH